MSSSGGYASPGAVDAAMKEAARRAYAADPSLTITERLRLEYFRRFLSRVFAEGDDSPWILKGGTGMLARVASARATTDVDLFARGHSLDAALEELTRLASLDLDDFFRFVLTARADSVDGDQQAYTEGCQATFDVYLGANKKGSFHVDLVVNVTLTDDVEVVTPAGALDLPKLRSHVYRLYPVVDQIADKVCATLAVYGGRSSSREKDLVDLVVLAVTQDIDAARLRTALEREAAVRSLVLPRAFGVPSGWGLRYAGLASQVPVCRPYGRIDLAMDLMRRFLDPVLDASASGKTWDRTALSWR